MKPMSAGERRTSSRPPIPVLESGDRMKQPEFHRRYEAYPGDVKIELIGGTVYVASPERTRHGRSQPELSGVLWTYKNATPGTDLLDNTTTILDEDNEPQPDLSLRIVPECGGQSGESEDEYLLGSPELVVEIAHSTRSVDLNQKRETYEAAGAKEYLVLVLENPALHWFDFRAGTAIKPDRAGIHRSRVFPGLWIDGPALIARDGPRLLEVVHTGIASKEHAAFVKRLDRARRKHAQD